MGRIAIWAVNALMFALCCFLVASLVNALVGDWMAAPPASVAEPIAPAPAPARSWADRQVILDRNLFNVSTLLPEPVRPEDEPLEATRLPLRLLGTVASSDPDEAWAAVEDQQNRKELVVRVGEHLLDQATVVRIERRRIVLQNGARREELALGEEEPAPPVRQAAARPGRSTPAPLANLQERVRQLSENRFGVERGDVAEAARNPAELFSQARILPKYEEGQMTGVQLSSIQPGSIFEEIGLREGDTVTQVNGIVVTGPQDSAALLKELAESDEFTVNVVGADGATRTLHYVVGSE
jgi:general secretion pathway protein C